jgi:hypothetical protein
MSVKIKSQAFVKQLLLEHVKELMFRGVFFLSFDGILITTAKKIKTVTIT